MVTERRQAWVNHRQDSHINHTVQKSLESEEADGGWTEASPLRTRGPSRGQQRSQDQVDERVLRQGPRCTALRQWAGELGGRLIASLLR